ncbi:MAG TPA: ABC transporter ATP-binding protein [Spirochaetota bacterium]|nr:ABC transporter ATP-binding protein [Spirochaetota bacterium]HPI91406.1 ABC transporter ATP-binding protein [Spirochaetota bacterium]HPR49846.1 ABC transporter ATP-binding protein [Spirochaetota bacterium]
MDDFLVFDGISKSFGNLKVLENVSLSIEKGSIFSILGPSGCGKTTLLRICAGFETPDTGRVILNGKDITLDRPNKRRVNTVFQNYSLFPHMSVRENIAFGLQMSGFEKKRITSEVDKYLELIQMSDQADKKTTKLSGGQMQRVAIARALINKPQILLLDEPLAALDLKLRQRMLVELDWIHDEVGITFLYVTHDQGEAMSISDYIAIMNRGKIEQHGTPAQVYEAPTNSFVAAFIGDTNFFETEITAIEGSYCRLNITDFDDNIIVYNDKNFHMKSRVYLSIRPEKFVISFDEPEHHNKLNRVRGTVEEIIYMGTHTTYWVRVGDYRIQVRQSHDRFLLDQRIIERGNDVFISWHADNCYILDRYDEKDESLLTLPDDDLTVPPENVLSEEK